IVVGKNLRPSRSIRVSRRGVVDDIGIGGQTVGRVRPAKVALHHGQCRYGGDLSRELPLASGFYVPKKEQLVLLDGPAYAAAELIEDIFGNARDAVVGVEIVVSLKFVVEVKLIHIAVEMVGS